MGDMFGRAAEAIYVPIHPLSRSDIIQEILPGLGRVITNMLKATFTLKQFLKETPDWCREMTARIEQIETREALLALWHSKLQPYAIKAWWGHTTGASGVLNIMALERKLTKLVGKEDANLLLSNLRGDTGLASLGPVVGIAMVMKGEMSHEEYMGQYGHRGPHEFELSIPHPAEDANWLEKQIEEFEKSNVDVDELLQKQWGQYDAARKRFQVRRARKTMKDSKACRHFPLSFAAALTLRNGLKMPTGALIIMIPQCQWRHLSLTYLKVSLGRPAGSKAGCVFC